MIRFRRRFRWSAVLASGLVAAFLPSCTEAKKCEAESDCAADQTCIAGLCAPLCAEDSECTAGKICESGVCQSADRCNDNADCENGRICISAVCRSQQVECESSVDCAPNFICCQGGCYPPGTETSCEAACSDRGDCSVGQECVNRICVGAEVDAGAEVESDADIPDVTELSEDPDIVDSSEIADIASDTPDLPPDVDAPDSDNSCTFNSECAADEICLGNICQPDPGPCEGRDDGQLGERCTAPADCCNGLCLGNVAAGRGICSEFCNSWRECNPIGAGLDELFCIGTADGSLCALSDDGNRCATANDCLGGLCLVSQFGNVCSHRCRNADDCRSGEACGLVAFDTGSGTELIASCTPIGQTPCDLPSTCLSGTCASDDETGVSYCTVICDNAGACPDNWACEFQPDASLSICVPAT